MELSEGNCASTQVIETQPYDNMFRAVIQLVETVDNPAGTRLVEFGLKDSALAGPDLVEMAREIQQADRFCASTACGKLEQILEQMRFLQLQAKKILEQSSLDAELHHAACNLVKRVGQIYYYYRRSSGQKYFSIIAPEEWPDCPHEFLGAFRLKEDMNFEPIDSSSKVDEFKRQDAAQIKQLVKSVTSSGANRSTSHIPGNRLPAAAALTAPMSNVIADMDMNN